MILSFAGWSILIAIGVSDARGHRIPNKLIIMLTLIVISEFLLFNSSDIWINEILSRVFGFTTCFLIGIFIYLFKAMAAGDVKLLGVLGLIVGNNSLLNFVQFVLWSCVVVGCMYLMLARLERSQNFRNSKQCVHVRHSLDRHMPFAPILVIGLAMYQYFSFS